LGNHSALFYGINLLIRLSFPTPPKKHMSQGSGFRQGMSIAFRLGVEMAVATFLGAVMGYALDRFFNTKPWLMVIGLFFGVAAGGLGVYRVAQEIQFTDNDSNEEDQ